MRVLVFGSGGVGGYFGGLLCRAGHAVTFVARGAHLEALQRVGLRIEQAGTQLPAFGVHAVEIPPRERFDVALLCVKTYHLEAVCAQLVASGATFATVLSLLNGVESEEIVRDFFAASSHLSSALVAGALCNVGAERVAPGVIRQVAGGQIVIGELAGGMSPRLDGLVARFGEAGIDCRGHGDIRQAIWRKFLWNVGFNPVCAIHRCDVGGALDVPALRQQIVGAMGEAVAVGRALGIAVSNSDIDTLMQTTASRLRAVRPSMLQDCERGTPTEHEALSGYVVRAAAGLGMQAPINLALLRYLSPPSMT